MLRRNLIEAIPEQDWAPIPYWMEGAADVAETEYIPFQSERDAVPVQIIVRRVKPSPGSQLTLFATYSYHARITDRDGDTLALETDHRRHAEIENAVRDLRQRLPDRPSASDLSSVLPNRLANPPQVSSGAAPAAVSTVIPCQNRPLSPSTSRCQGSYRVKPGTDEGACRLCSG